MNPVRTIAPLFGEDPFLTLSRHLRPGFPAKIVYLKWVIHAPPPPPSVILSDLIRPVVLCDYFIASRKSSRSLVAWLALRP
jgi:hypothetical protein